MARIAGKTKYRIGTRIRITGITDKGDMDLNGRTGKLWHPFPGFPIQDVGIYLDPDKSGKGDTSVKANIKLGEFELIKKERK